MRTKLSTFNAFSNAMLLFATTVCSFAVRTVFIKMLGQECLGLDGLFTNILSMLSLAELGIGTAINFSLYKPLSNGDINKISILMSFYKKIYRIIGIVVLILGLLIVPFLHYFIKGATIDNIELIYILYLLNTVLSYFITYKNILLTADQKDYKIGIVKTFFTFIVYGAQTIILFITRNYILYLIILLVFRQIERIYINYYISRHYTNINFNSNDKLDQEEKKQISTNVKGMVFHKIGNYCLNSTDNILISTFVGINIVGIYSNYLSIINVAKNLLVTTLSGATASFGNMIALENEKKNEKVFDRMNFLCFIVTGIITIILFNCFNILINIWLGRNYILGLDIIIVIMVNFYLFCILIPIDIVKNAAGLYDIDKIFPLIQVFVNLFISIILSKMCGLIGILIGTLVSYIFIISWSKPYFVYKKVFKKSPKNYYLSEVKKFGILVFDIVFSYILLKYLYMNNGVSQLIINAIISLLVFICSVFILYKNTEEFKYITNKIFTIVKKVKAK